MRHFGLITRGIDVLPLALALQRQPELWNANQERKVGPHAAMSDIWIRYRPREELKTPQDYKGPHVPVWYPAYYSLPQLRPIIFGLMQRVESVHLGGVLITKIPPGGRIEPHDDRGSWHAEYHNCKIYVPIQTNDECVNVCEDEAVCMQLGEAWTFNNLVTHSVENQGIDDRITLIICCRCEG